MRLSASRRSRGYSLFRDLQKALAETEQDAMYLGKEEDMGGNPAVLLYTSLCQTYVRLKWFKCVI
jgi:hypothetical protein